MIATTTLALLAAAALPADASSEGPAVELWYGNRQTFGALGHPQRWVGVLGTARDPDGVASLAFRLNGGAERPLALGPDGRRLVGSGDFVVELGLEELRDGENELLLVATDRTGARTEAEVTLDFVAGSRWPADYAVDWSRVERVEDAVQVVDGRWRLAEGGLRTEQVGYDRLVAVGELDWTDYEVTVPVTVHGIDRSAFGSPISHSPALALDLRWQGHTDRPVRCPQPRCGWEPTGASALFAWEEEGPGSLHLFADPMHYPWRRSATTDAAGLAVGATSWLKARVETTPIGSLYSFKVWGADEPEPARWTLQRTTTAANLARGALLLKAHHVDVTFGPLTVLALGGTPRWWDRATKVTSVLARSPLLLVALAAAGLALARRGERPRAARRVFAAAVCLGAAAVLDVLLELKLPDALQAGGLAAEEITVASRLGELVRSLLTAVAAALLVVGLLGRRSAAEVPRDAEGA